MRTPITLKIKFKSAGLSQFIERYSVDVSASGIFIRTKEPLKIGTQLRFEFQLQDASALIVGEGTVVWTREPDPTRASLAPGMGVRFDTLTEVSRGVLDHILLEKGKREDGAAESRFDAGVRASGAASGTTGGDRETATPLPVPLPSIGDDKADYGTESTRVMGTSQSQALAESTREPWEEAGEAARAAAQAAAQTAAASNAELTPAQSPFRTTLQGGRRAPDSVDHVTPPRDEMAAALAVAMQSIDAMGGSSETDDAAQHDAGAATMVEASPSSSGPTNSPSDEATFLNSVSLDQSLFDQVVVDSGADGESAMSQSSMEPIVVPHLHDPPGAVEVSMPTESADSSMDGGSDSVSAIVDSLDELAPAKVEAPTQRPSVVEARSQRQGTVLPQPFPLTPSSASHLALHDTSSDDVAVHHAEDGAKPLEIGESGRVIEATSPILPLEPAPSAPAPRMSVPPVKRRRSPLVPAALAVVVIGGVGAVWFTMNGSDPVKPTTPTVPVVTPPVAPVVVEKTPPVAPPVVAPPVVAPAVVAVAPVAPPAVAAVPTGLELDATSTPPGATITVDDKPVPGVTPTKIGGLQPGKSYAVVLTLKGYRTVHQKWTAAAGKVWNAKLDPTEKLLEVTSDPSGATVFLDGKSVGTTGHKALRVKLGKLAAGRVLMVKRSGYAEDERTLSADGEWKPDGDREVLTVVATLLRSEGPTKPVADARKPDRNSGKETAETTPPVAPVPVVEKPPVVQHEEKPVFQKMPEKPVAEKPVPEKPVAEKPLFTKMPEKPVEKPAEEKPAVKPVAKPAEKPKDSVPEADVKVPSWMK